MGILGQRITTCHLFFQSYLGCPGCRVFCWWSLRCSSSEWPSIYPCRALYYRVQACIRRIKVLNEEVLLLLLSYVSSCCASANRRIRQHSDIEVFASTVSEPLVRVNHSYYTIQSYSKFPWPWRDFVTTILAEYSHRYLWIRPNNLRKVNQNRKWELTQSKTSVLFMHYCASKQKHDMRQNSNINN